MKVKKEYDKVVLVDASKDSITITWPEIDGAVRYILEYRKNKRDKHTGLLCKFKTLDKSITKNIVKKGHMK